MYIYRVKQLTLIFLLFTSSFLLGQTYYPLPLDSATWTVERYEWGQLPNLDECITRYYGYGGDTVINNLTYGKLYGNNLPADYPYTDVAFNFPTATYVAAVREDTSKKVWIINAGDTTGILYYDFALNIGDTFCFDYFFPALGCHTVVAVDSILIGGNFRRQIHFNSLNGEAWVEGVGSLSGWFEYHPLASWDYNLVCHSHYQTQLYNMSGNCYCDTYHGVGINELTPSTLTIHPNPTTSQLTISLAERTTANITIRNALGQLVLSEQIEGTTHNIRLDAPAGIYFFQLEADGQVITKKVVKH